MLTVVHSLYSWLSVTETWLYNQVRFLPTGVTNYIVCETTHNLNQFTVPNIHCLADMPRWQSLTDRFLRKAKFRRHLGLLTKVLAGTNAHVLHSHYGDMAYANSLAARRMGVHHVATFYGYDVNFLPKKDYRWYERYKTLFAQVDRILCEGPHMAKCIIALGCPPEKVEVHHLGVEVDRIPFNPRRWYPGQPLRILIAGSFREKKGIPYALEAIGHLQREVDLQVTIIGDANGEQRSQDEKRVILATIDRYQLQHKVRQLGYQPHQVLLKEAEEHHIFLSPSIAASDGDTEGGAPVTLIEMAASGMPIVSTNHCDIPEVVQHKVTGLLADERDVTGLVQQLRWLIEHPDLWQEMVTAGRRRVECEFNALRQGQRLAAIYQSLATKASNDSSYIG